jgi:MFS transporter, FSR family, fosmidomycin resistance protein
MAELSAPAPLSRDVRLVGLVGGAHFLSHFFQLVLPPLFPQFRDTFGVGYTELGIALMVFYAVSGVSQTAAGFLVDRLGARTVLVGGLALFSAAIMLAGFAVSYWMLLLVAVLGGAGNSVFHPADYAMLTAGVHQSRIGRAYSVHTLGGNLGWAAAPVTVIFLSALFGWRNALLICGLAGLGMALFLYVQTAGFGEPRPRPASPAPRGASVKVLLSAPVLLCFLYFLLLSISLVGVQTFLPPTLDALHGIPVEVATAALTGFLLGSSGGVVLGGFLADKTVRHDLLVCAGLLIAALLLFAAGPVDLGATGVVAAFAAAGFFSGATTPSRDMLVRGATPSGATGRVFGFVYSGLDLGSAVTPPVLGLLVDHGAPIGVFFVISGTLVLTTFSVVALRRFSRR